MLRNDITVSVIMNCFNGERYLNEAISSIYSQSYTNWEIIFWDNCSSDRSASIAQSYDSKLKYFLSNKTMPLGKARNLALQKANGDFICFLDCDDIYLPDKLEVQLAAVKANNAVLSYSGWLKINESGDVLNKFILKNEYKNQFENLLKSYKVNFQSLMIDRSYLAKNNIEFDENTTFSPDFNLVLKIAYDEPLLSISKPLVKYRVHKDSMSIHKKRDKLVDFDYTINYLKTIGAAERYKNFNFIKLRAKYNILFIDLIEEKKYLESFCLIFSYLFSIIKLFFKSFKSKKYV